MSYSYRSRHHRRGGVVTWRKVAAVAGLTAILLGFVLAGAKLAREPARTPVIFADTRPVRIRPAKPGGLYVPNADLMLDEVEDEAVSLAAPPEEPALPALMAKQATDTFAELPPE